MSALLEAVDVTVRYGDRVAADSVSLTLAPGHWTCLIGPNGAGKSSMLRAITGLVPCEGTVSISGDPVAALTPRARAAKVAFVPQTPEMPGDMTGFEYVLLGRTPYIAYFGIDSAHDRRVVAEAIDRLDLHDMAHRALGALSGGERQRLVIARALVQQAPLLVLDEPTSALDIGHQAQALELVDRLRHEEGLGVLSAMHDLTLAGMYADRLVLLRGGRVVAAGTPAEVLHADVLADHYGVAVDVRTHDDGTITVHPRRPPGAIRRSG
jgi:iron complex transport system ATP-binding protein